MYLRHQGLCYTLAKKMSSNHKAHFEELLEEAKSRLAEMVCGVLPTDHYDPTKAAESTWVYQNLFWYLQTLVKNKTKRRTHELNTSLPAPQSGFLTLLESLTEESIQIVQLIIAAPSEVLMELVPRNKVRAKRSVIAHLKSLGWTRSEINRAFQEIENVLNT